MSSTIADSYTEYFVGYTISYIDTEYDSISCRQAHASSGSTEEERNANCPILEKKPATRNNDGVLYIYDVGTPELDFDISNELQPISEYGGTVPNHVYLSTDKVTWDFGDGTKKVGLNVQHKYTKPGIYTILVSLRDYDGRVRVSKYRQKIHVAEFVKSEVKWESDDMIARRCDTILAGSPSPKYTIKTSTSKSYFTKYRKDNPITNNYESQKHKTKHTISLYVSGSESQPGYKTDYVDYKYAQFDRLWKFMESPLEGQPLDDTPINSVTIEPSAVYIRSNVACCPNASGTYDIEYGYFIEPNITSTDSSSHVGYVYDNSSQYTNIFDGVSTNKYRSDFADERSQGIPDEDRTYELAGHIGLKNILYLDDTAKVYLSRHQHPVMLFANLQTSSAYTSDIEVNLDNDILFSVEDWNVDVLPVKVLYNPATQLSITPAGVHDIIFPKNKFQKSKMAFNIALVDDIKASTLKSHPYPELKVSGTQKYFSPDWELQPLAGQSSVSDIINGVNDTITIPTNGCINQYIKPMDQTGSYQLSATCTIKDQPYANKEVEAYFITNMHTDRIFVMRPGYMDKIYAFEPEYTISVTDFYTSIFKEMNEPVESLDTIDAMTNYFSIGVNSKSQAWIADSDRDAIILVSRFGEHLDTITLPRDIEPDLFESIITSPRLPGERETLIDSDHAYGISSVGIDSRDNVWVSLADLPQLLRFDDLPEDATSRETDPSKDDGPIRVQIEIPDCDPLRLHPQKLETDRDDNIWVSVLYGNRETTDWSEPLADEWTDRFYLLKYSKKEQSTGVKEEYEQTALIKFDTGVHLHDILVDGYNDIWVTNCAPTRDLDGYNPSIGGLYHISKDGEILNTITDYIDPDTNITEKFDKPSQLIMDMRDNLWICHRGNELLRVHTDLDGHIPRYTFDMKYSGGPKWPDDDAAMALQGRPHAIEGLSCDSDNRILVVNNHSKNLYAFDAEDLTRREWDPAAVNDPIETQKYNEPPIPLNSDKPFHEDDSTYMWQPGEYHTLQAFGDWTGIRWIQKYVKYTQNIRTVTGVSNPFNIVDVVPDVHKINEYHGYAETIESISLQPVLSDSDNFINKIIQPAAGDLAGSPEELGKVTYEKTANFARNISDVDTSNVAQFYSMCSYLGYDAKDFNFIAPATIKRLTDLFSISYSKLVGARDRTETNFNSLGQNPSLNLGKNLGRKMGFDTEIIMAGIPIVACELFDKKYRLIKPMTIRNPEATANDHLSTYALSGYDPSWGWRLSYPENEPVNHYYDFFLFKPNKTYSATYRASNNTASSAQLPPVDQRQQTISSDYKHRDMRQVEGIIDWDNPLMQLVEVIENDTTSIDSWDSTIDLDEFIRPTDDTHINTMITSIVELIFEKKLRQGLEIDE
jgi:hypothetical protein